MPGTYADAARLVLERCDLLATFSEEPGRITRRFATLPMHQVHAMIREWLRTAGMTTEVDAMGNLIGRREADGLDEATFGAEGWRARTLLLGSHLDTVRDAGRYDGILGVMVALVCLERLHERGERLPFAVELLGFADEEGLRYPCVYMGSKAVTGRLGSQDLALRDGDGMSMAEALRAFGCEPDALSPNQPRWRSEELLGYCEVHIEQGPVLETRDLPLAVVSSIVGQQREIFRFEGVQGHAGTLPMELRHDALCAAAEFVLKAELVGRSMPGLVTTVGQMRVEPGASNVVPGLVELSLDLRHEDDRARAYNSAKLLALAQADCEPRGVKVTSQSVHTTSTVFCAPRLRQRLEQALSLEGYPVFSLPSGAGHDGVALSTLTEIAMLFVRCRGGISHNPAEAVRADDVAAAIAVLERFLSLTAREVLHDAL